MKSSDWNYIWIIVIVTIFLIIINFVHSDSYQCVKNPGKYVVNQIQKASKEENISCSCETDKYVFLINASGTFGRSANAATYGGTAINTLLNYSQINLSK